MRLRYHSPMANKVTSKELLETNDQYTYVDVREAGEIEEGKIDTAVNIPLGQLGKTWRYGFKRKLSLTAAVDIEGILQQMN